MCAMDHWQGFYEFCRYDKAAGGPDPHMACTAEVARQRGLDQAGTAWLGALYTAVYNVPTALALFDAFPTPAALPEDLLTWLDCNWPGIAFRRERKAVRSPLKLAQCLQSVAAFCEHLFTLDGYVATWAKIEDPTARFEQAFDDVCTVYGFGRYIGQKYLEYGRRYCAFDVQVQDIRARDGWSPREGLALLLPEHRDVLIDGGDSPETISHVEALAADFRTSIKDLYGLELDFYELQVLLCDYKQSAVGRRQYPGRSQDSELDYAAKIKPHWGPATAMFTARKAIFPHWTLGELSRWTAVRKELGRVLTDHGYTWSDSLYNYPLTTNLARPVPR